MSISSLGMVRLYWVAKWHQGFCRAARPLIHIFEGLKVWHQVTRPAQAGSWFAWRTTSVISRLVLAVTLYTSLQGSRPQAFSASVISAARVATVSSTSGP